MSERVQGHCPGCGSTSLFVGSGGYLTCSRLDCPNPTALADILEDGETQHVVLLRATEFTIRHPLIERVGGALESCDLHTYLSSLDGPPGRPGLYRVWRGERLTWQLIGDLPEEQS